MANFFKLKDGQRFKFHSADNVECVKRNDRYYTIKRPDGYYVGEVDLHGDARADAVLVPRTITTEVWEK